MPKRIYIPTDDLMLRTSIKAHNTADRKAKGKRKVIISPQRITEAHAPVWLLDAVTAAIRSGNMQPGKSYTFYNDVTGETIQGVELTKVGA